MIGAMYGTGIYTRPDFFGNIYNFYTDWRANIVKELIDNVVAL